MRTTFIAAALSLGALSAANPLPQEINLAAVIAAPDPTYTIALGVTGQVVPLATAAAIKSAESVTSVTVQSVEAAETAPARLAKKDAAVTCAPLPAGATGAPTYSPSAGSDFLAATAFAAKASDAPTPPGYDRTFVNLASTNNAYGYMGFTTFQDYDTNTCGSMCTDKPGCMAFNMYYERNPSVTPDATGCPDPAPVTMIKCVFWGGPVSAENALNNGQTWANFQVIMTGSNGYVSQKIATPAGYTGLTYLGNSGINAPYDTQGYNTYMGFKIFTDGGWNSQYCADYCSAQSDYNRAHPPNDGSPVQTCQFFNTYLLYKNTQDQLQGQYCVIYSEPWAGTSYATNDGQWNGNDHYQIYNSFSFSNLTGVVAPNRDGAVHQASKDIAWATLQPYCSTLLGYQTPLATTTATVTATTTPMTSTTATVTISSTTTITSTTTFKAAAAAKRSDAGSIPEVLTKYPASVRSSACSLLVTSPTVTSTTTTTISITTTAATVVVTSTASVKAIATATVTSCKLPTNSFPQTNCLGVAGPYTVNGKYFSIDCNTFYDYFPARLIADLNNVSDFPSCLYACATTPGCVAVNYNPQHGYCGVLGVGAVAQKEPNSPGEYGATVIC